MRKKSNTKIIPSNNSENKCIQRPKNRYQNLKRDSDTSSSELSDAEDIANEPANHLQKRKLRSTAVKHNEIISALDRTNTSHRNAAFILSATLQSVGINDSSCSKDTIARHRRKLRQKESLEIQQSFQPNECLTVHWDGKMLPSLKNKSKVERLSVSVSSPNLVKLLGIPPLTASTGDAQANAVFKLLEKWNLTEKVRSMCFDTTASNTGIHKGACTLLQKKMNKDLFYFACRHHIAELVVGSAFDVLFEKSTGPNIQLFQKFQNSWDSIEKLNYQNSLKDNRIAKLIPSSNRSQIIKFLKSQLNENHPRDDYKEVLELGLLFLGSNNDSNSITIKAPGAVHRARWMAKIIYALKIYLYRNQFELEKSELASLCQFNSFVVKTYIKYWFTCQTATVAPYNDLQLLQELSKYNKTMPDIAKTTVETFLRHLWYLSESLVTFSFFDSRLTVKQKRVMVTRLNETRKPESFTKVTLTDNQITKIRNLKIEDFVSERSTDFFLLNNLPSSFLKEDPSLWHINSEYIQCEEFIKNIKVVNDVAERGVALATTFNKCITRSESDFQNLLQTVEKHRKDFPTASKKNIQSGYKTRQNIKK